MPKCSWVGLFCLSFDRWWQCSQVAQAEHLPCGKQTLPEGGRAGAWESVSACALFPALPVTLRGSSGHPYLSVSLLTSQNHSIINVLQGFKPSKAAVER